MSANFWIPAFAGMTTIKGIFQRVALTRVTPAEAGVQVGTLSFNGLLGIVEEESV